MMVGMVVHYFIPLKRLRQEEAKFWANLCFRTRPCFNKLLEMLSK